MARGRTYIRLNVGLGEKGRGEGGEERVKEEE